MHGICEMLLYDNHIEFYLQPEVVSLLSVFHTNLLLINNPIINSSSFWDFQHPTHPNIDQFDPKVHEVPPQGPKAFLARIAPFNTTVPKLKD